MDLPSTASNVAPSTPTTDAFVPNLETPKLLELAYLLAPTEEDQCSSPASSLSPRSKLINVLSEAIDKDAALENSYPEKRSPEAETCDTFVDSTRDIMDSYLTVGDSSTYETTTYSQESSSASLVQNIELSESNVNVSTALKKDSNPVDKVPNIINLNTVDVVAWLKDPNNVYIGRAKDNLKASKWGNPSIITPTNGREQALKFYENYIHDNLELMQDVTELAGKTLGCWCSPQHCHGEILHKLAGNNPIYQQLPLVPNNEKHPECTKEVNDLNSISEIKSDIALPASTESNLLGNDSIDKTTRNKCHSISLPNLAKDFHSSEEEFEIDAEALSKMLWSINRKLDDHGKTVDKMNARIDNMETYIMNLLVGRLQSHKEEMMLSVNRNAETCEQARSQIHGNLLSKLDCTIKDNEILRRQWSEHMSHLKENLQVMNSESESANGYDSGGSSSHASSISNAVVDERDEKIEKLEELVNDLKDKNFELDCRVIECEQYSRRENLVISGIPEEIKDIQELSDTVVFTLKKLGIHIGLKDISACHRLGRYDRNDRFPRRVIVRFVNRGIVHRALNNRGRLWDLRRELQMNLRFYENLNTSNLEVLRIAKGLQEEGIIFDYFVWMGFVKIIENEGDKPFRVRHPDVLRERFGI